ncbi:MAG: hypothetical protein Q9184_008217, partial [Pyrenodesmia sp. 2 TL-2023]
LCKEWLLRNTGPSATRAAAVGKYLVTLCASPPALGNVNSSTRSKASRPSRVSHRRHQISILYMLHDLLHHTKFHGAAGTAIGVSAQDFEPYVIQLVASAAAHDSGIHTGHFRKLQDLLALWSEDSYYPPTLIATLKQIVQNASHFNGLRIEQTDFLGDPAVARNAGSVESRKDAPYILPPNHGDVADPFYDLPAGNLMPRIVPKSTTPIDPQAVKPLQLRAGPADEGLVHAVKHLLQEAEFVYGTRRPQSEIEVSDINELGQLVIRDNMLDESSDNEAYYGWSRAFCKRMKLQSRGKKILGSSHHSRDTNLGLPHPVPAPPALLHHGFLGPGHIPIPPPPPPNYRGPWPPPPPPPPPPPASLILARTFQMSAAFEPPIHPTSSVPTQPSPLPPPPSLIDQTFLQDSAQALNGQATSQYTAQIGYNNTGNRLVPNNQPWQHPYPATTSTREGV